MQVHHSILILTIIYPSSRLRHHPQQCVLQQLVQTDKVHDGHYLSILGQLYFKSELLAVMFQHQKPVHHLFTTYFLATSRRLRSLAAAFRGK